MLSWVEKKVAATIFSDMPTGSIEEALQHFLNAEQLRAKPWKENRLFLAKCYIQNGKYADAISWIDQALAVPKVNAEVVSFLLIFLSKIITEFICKFH